MLVGNRHVITGRSTLARGARGAFTLIELLVVIAIISIVVGITLPAIGKAREAADGVKCLANLRAFGPAFEMYRKDFKDLIPRAAPYPGQNPGGVPLTDAPIHVVLGDYFSTTPNVRENPADPNSPLVRSDPYWCPRDRDPEAAATTGISYFYWGGTLIYAREILAADDNPVFSVTKFYESNPTFPMLADVRDFHPLILPRKRQALYFGDWRADRLEVDPADPFASVGP